MNMDAYSKQYAADQRLQYLAGARSLYKMYHGTFRRWCNAGMSYALDPREDDNSVMAAARVAIAATGRTPADVYDHGLSFAHTYNPKSGFDEIRGDSIKAKPVPPRRLSAQLAVALAQ